MPRPIEPPPLIDVKHDFVRSLDRFIYESERLADTVRIVLSRGDMYSGEEVLRERLATFQLARFGETEPASTQSRQERDPSI